jgi:hypothetical protein
MVETLDTSYIAHDNWLALREKDSKLKLDGDLRVVGRPSLKGRRILYVGYDDAGSLFIPGQSVDSGYGADTIRFRTTLSNDDVIPWIETVAHESAHAFARVTAKGKGPATDVDRVRAAVQDECNTRKVEHKVVAEIRDTSAGKKALARHPVPPPARTCDCERDWFPTRQKRTYLEQFVLGMHWESTARQLGTAEIQEITQGVAAIPLKWPSGTQPTMLLSVLRGTPVAGYAKVFPVLKSPAAQAALVLRVVDASWRQLIKKVGEGSPTWTGGAQQLRLERHARLFFKIAISYTKCP